MGMTDGYPFKYVMTDKYADGNLLECVYQYSFRSSKSNHTYIVRVERYAHHSYCLKFFDKAVRYSKNKYSLRTNTFEPRTIFYTLYHILLEVFRKDALASFFFIGSEDEKDVVGEATRRYRIYRRFVSSTIGGSTFEHYRVNELSLYILVNKNGTNAPLSLAKQITEAVRKALLQ